MTDLNLLIAKAQIWISALFLLGYFLVIILFMTGYADIPADYKEAFAGLLSLLTGGGLTILYFWYQRQRSGGVPDPTVTTTTIETAPPKTKIETVVTPTPSASPPTDAG